MSTSERETTHHDDVDTDLRAEEAAATDQGADTAPVEAEEPTAAEDQESDPAGDEDHAEDHAGEDGEDEELREHLDTSLLPVMPTGPRAEKPSDAVVRVRAAARSRAAHPRRMRVHQLKALRRLLEENEQRILDALAADLGKSPIEALLTEIMSVRQEVDHALLHLTDWMDRRPAKLPLALRPAHAEVQARPKGLVLIIGAWNYPVQLLLAPLVGALAAGNTVVLSPSEKASATSTLLRELLPQYLDSALIAVVEGGKDCNTELLTHPWDHILYTGGERVGRIVYEAAAKTLSPVTLELGGKSPVVVTPSRNATAMARRIAWGKFTNAGQTCVAPDYILAVGEEAERELLTHLPRAITEFYGEDPQASNDYGRLISTEHAQRLKDMLDDAVAHGARVIAGGRVDPVQRYMAPTVVADVAPDSPLMAEEIFGPILPILRVDHFQEALDFITDRPHPLAAYLFTDRPRYRRAFEDQVSAGVVSTDVTLVHAGITTLPFGGIGASGMGAYHGIYGFETFSHLRPALTKSDQVDTLKAVYPPYGWLKRRTIPKML
ncbi:MAG: aldehyde dehydrogenase family protein [Micrococcus sp.]|nr:aldehyde dehydrogenase family protein [Micrococcus sp.]